MQGTYRLSPFHLKKCNFKAKRTKQKECIFLLVCETNLNQFCIVFSLFRIVSLIHSVSDQNPYFFTKNRITFSPACNQTVNLSKGVVKAPFPPHLNPSVLPCTLEVFVFSKLWYLAQAILLQVVLHRLLSEGGLNISCRQPRAQALWAKHACCTLGSDGYAAQHQA